MLLLATPIAAEVRVDSARSAIRDGWWRLDVVLGFSAITPYRVFTRDNPHQLVLAFKGVDWSGVEPEAWLEPGRARAVRVIEGVESFLIVDLAGPLEVTSAGMVREEAGATLSLTLKKTSAEAFAASAQSEGPDPVGIADEQTDIFTVVIDPGHGGIDPGAGREGVSEADLMLALGHEVAAAINAQTSVEALLSRQEDLFVPLHRRISIAREVGADLLISLHADALAEDDARGVSVYTLVRGGGDVASQQMVERHEPADLLEGLDLQGQGDQVAQTLLDLARQKTGPEGRSFADVLVAQMRDNGVRLNSRPRREGQLAVLSAADFPSVLIEAGFLSNRADREALQSASGRAPLVQAITEAVAEWAAMALRD